MARHLSRSVASVLLAIGVGMPACGSEELVGPGGECFRASECEPGLVCVQGRCSNDLTEIVSQVDGPSEPPPEEDGSAGAAGASVDGGAGSGGAAVDGGGTGGTGGSPVDAAGGTGGASGGSGGAGGTGATGGAGGTGATGGGADAGPSDAGAG